MRHCGHENCLMIGTLASSTVSHITSLKAGIFSVQYLYQHVNIVTIGVIFSPSFSFCRTGTQINEGIFILYRVPRNERWKLEFDRWITYPGIFGSFIMRGWLHIKSLAWSFIVRRKFEQGSHYSCVKSQEQIYFYITRAIQHSTSYL